MQFQISDAQLRFGVARYLLELVHAHPKVHVVQGDHLPRATQNVANADTRFAAQNEQAEQTARREELRQSAVGRVYLQVKEEQQSAGREPVQSAIEDENLTRPKYPNMPQQQKIKPPLEGNTPGQWHVLEKDFSGPYSGYADRISHMLTKKLCHSPLPRNTEDVRVDHSF